MKNFFKKHFEIVMAAVYVVVAIIVSFIAVATVQASSITAPSFPQGAGGTGTTTAFSTNSIVYQGASSLQGSSSFVLTPAGWHGIGTGNPQGFLDVSTATSGTPSLTGVYLSFAASTFTDNNTASGTTASNMAFNSLPVYTLTAVNASTTYTNVYGLYVKGAPTLQSTANPATTTNSTALFIDTNAVSASTTNAYGLQVSAPTGATNNFAANFVGNVKLSHLIGNSAAPAMATSTGLGTGGCTSVLCQASLTGTDTAGFVGAYTGTSPAGNATLVTLTFASAYGAAPYCVVSNASTTTSSVWSTTTTSSLIIKSNAALAASSNYAWYYHCEQ